MRWPTAQARPCIRRDFILPALRREVSAKCLWSRACSRVSICNTNSSLSCSQIYASASAGTSHAAAAIGKSWRRSASSRSTVRIPTKPRTRTVLPQGLLKADDKAVEKADDATDGGGGEAVGSTVSKATARNGSRGGAMTVIDQVEQNMRKFENCVVLTRIGDFYELYFEHAQQYGPLLGLKVATKSTVNGDVAMSGFPHFHLDRYLKILVQDLNCYVALSNQFLNDVEARLNTNRLYDRRVVRVITPGTLIDENFMDPTANNFCLAIYVDPEKRPKTQAQQRGAGREVADVSEGGGGSVGEDEVPDTGVAAGTSALGKLRMAETELGLAWLDLSTGEFYTQKSTYAQLSSLLTRIGPKEIVLSNGLRNMQKDVLLDILGPEQQIVTWQEASNAALPVQQWQDMLDSPMPERVAKAFSPDEVHAGSMVLKYVKTQLQEQDTRLQPPIRRLESESMIIDRHTLRGLEVLKTLRDSDQVGAKGSLLHACRRTQTASGARLLRERMTRPSTVLSVIEDRLDLVEELLHRPKLREDARASLRQTFDTTRLVQKFSIGRGEPDDLINMSRTICLMQSTSDLLKTDASAKALCQLGQRFSLEEPIRLSERISKAIDEQGLLASQESEEAEASAVTSTAQGILASKGSMEDVKAYGLVARAKTLPSNSKLADSALDDGSGSGGGGGDKWTMQKDASPTLSQLHSELATLRRKKTDLVDSLRRRSGADSLILHWTPRYGHHGHVNRKKDVAASSEWFARTIGDRGTQRATRSFHVPEWEELGKEIDNTRLRIGSEERKVFVELRDEVVAGLVFLRRNAAVLDELDVACSSAVLAEEQGAVRPTLDAGRSLVIVGGRHPTVTLGLEERGRRFVENDCFMNTAGGGRSSGSDEQHTEFSSSASGTRQQSPSHSPSPSTSTSTTTTTSFSPSSYSSSRPAPPSHPAPPSPPPSPPSSLPSSSPSSSLSPPPPSPSSGGERIHLITGPNMAGKSTYLRQNALLTLMAQVGLFIPATAAHIGLVDALFARIGSADNLFSDQSTFMTEMLETAAILRGATDRSLVVMDEVGRGTTPEDGFAVAWAALWHLVRVNRCRALFASHFHGLADEVLRGSEEGKGEGWWEEDAGDEGEDDGGDLAGKKKKRRPAVGLYCTDVKELDAGLADAAGGGSGGFVFLHKVRPGVNRRSHALKVAGMAGLPGPALEMARLVLKQKEARQEEKGGRKT